MLRFSTVALTLGCLLGAAAEVRGQGGSLETFRQQSIERSTALEAASDRARLGSSRVAQDLPPGDPCGMQFRQYVPQPLGGVSLDVLGQAEAALDIALLLVDESPQSVTGAIDKVLLDKSQLLARRIVQLCRAGGCGVADEQE